MTIITDAYMHQMRTRAREYCFLLLKRGPNSNDPDARAIIWEHGCRNHALRVEG